MRYKKLVAAAVLSVGFMLATSSNSFAQSPGSMMDSNYGSMMDSNYGMMSKGYDMMGGFIAPYRYNYLNLTKEQQNQVKQLQIKHFASMQKLMRGYFDKINNLSGNETLNTTSKVRTEFFNQMIQQRNDYFNALSKILTKEQMKKFYSIHPALSK